MFNEGKHKSEVFCLWCPCVLSRFCHVWLFVTLWTVAHQTPLSMEFSRQEYWSRLPCPPPEDLPNPGIKPESPVTPALQADSLCTEPAGKPICLWEVIESVSCPVVPDSLWPHGLQPTGFSIHGIFWVRILEWLAISFFRASSQPRDWTWVSCIAGRFFPNWTTKEAPCPWYLTLILIWTWMRGDAATCPHMTWVILGVYAGFLSLQFQIHPSPFCSVPLWLTWLNAIMELPCPLPFSWVCVIESIDSLYVSF